MSCGNIVFIYYFCNVKQKEMSTKHSNTPPYRLGVALSGGGARGFAHAGALMAIEEAGLKPDIIAGVSAGSVVAVLYAGGVTPINIATLFANTTFRDFTELNIGHGGFLKIDKFARFIVKALKGPHRLEDLRIPTYIGVTNLQAGAPAVFHTGEIAPRLQASCSIPIVFSPVEIDGKQYVDGGVVRNHPAWIIRDKCRTLIGVNVSPLPSNRKCKSMIDVALRSYNLMAKANQSYDMELCDISVETPEIADYAVFDLKHIKNLFVSGYINMRSALKKAGLWNPDGSPKESIAAI